MNRTGKSKSDTVEMADEVGEKADELKAAGVSDEDAAIDAAMEEADVPHEMRMAVKSIVKSRRRVTKDAPIADESLTPGEEKTKDAMSECVSDKIAKLVAEGKPQEQAEAEAYSVCGEKAKDMGVTEETLKKIKRAVLLVRTTGVKGKRKKSMDDESAPAGFKALKNVSDTIDMHMKDLHPSEHAGAIGALEKAQKHIKSAMCKHYKDLMDEDVDDADVEVPEIVDDKLKSKRLTKAASSVVKDATEFLDDMAQAADTPKRYKGSMCHHSEALKTLMKEPDVEMLDKSDEDAIDEIGKRMADRMERFDRNFYRATGVK